MVTLNDGTDDDDIEKSTISLSSTKNSIKIVKNNSKLTTTKKPLIADKDKGFFPNFLRSVKTLRKFPKGQAPLVRVESVTEINEFFT